MKHYKQPDGVIRAFELDGSQDHLITSDMVPCDKPEPLVLTPTEITLSEIRAVESEQAVVDAMQRATRLVALEVAYNKYASDPRMAGKSRQEIQAILIAVDRDYRVLSDAEKRIKPLREKL